MTMSYKLMTILTFTLIGCGSSEARIDVGDIESKMTEIEASLTADAAANAELCLNYISLCEYGLSACLDPAVSKTFGSFCTELQTRCDATIAKLCTPSTDAGVATNGGAVGSSLPDVVVTSFSYKDGIFTSVVKNQGTAPTPAGISVAVGYSVDGVYKTWGGMSGSLAAGASVTLGTNGTPYVIPAGTHQIVAHVDDVNRFPESNENNNQLTQTITVTNTTTALIGPRPFVSTDVTKGTRFASPTGSGSTCAQATPCDLWTAAAGAKAGDVVFLRGGTYQLSKSLNLSTTATASAPLIVESYPGEHVVIDGSQHAKGTNVGVRITGKFIRVRGLEIKNMPQQGLWIGGTDNLVQGVHSHDNGLSGIQIYSPYDNFPYGTYGSRNSIVDCTVHGNFDQYFTSSGFANGGNADGISISSGTENRVEHCLVYGNSDDGIDTWRSTNSYVGYNIVHSNGIADGNGNGIKAGGAIPAAYAFVELNLVYSNKAVGLDYNTGKNVTFQNNTAWNNKAGRSFGSDTVAKNNICSETTSWGVTGIETNNSWQRKGSVTFKSTDPKSPDFLVPTVGGGFEDIGAFAR